MTLISDVERSLVKAFALAYFALNVYIRQEMHLYLLDAIAHACLAPAALDIETEAAGFIAAHLGLGQFRKEVPYGRERGGVGGGIRPGGPPYRRLVDNDDLVYIFRAGYPFVAARPFFGAVNPFRERPVDDLVDERGLARTRHARHAHEEAERYLDVYHFKIVFARPHYLQSLRQIGR